MPALHRFVGTPLLTWLVYSGTGGSRVMDSQSGYRAFRRDLAVELGLCAPGMEFASEMLVRAAQRQISICEFPLEYRERVGESKLSTWRDGIRHVRIILRLSPHLLLWRPGLAAILMGLIVDGATSVDPSGASVGSLSWQPIFFGTILMVVGLVSALGGAVLARFSPSASPHTRVTFKWVSSRPATAKILAFGVGAAAVGLALDIILFVLWINHATTSAATKLHVASLAQGLLLDGILLAVAAGMFRLMVPRGGSQMVPEPSVQPV